MHCQEDFFFTRHFILLLISNRKQMSDWRTFLVSHEAGLKKGTPFTKSHTLSFHVGSLFYQVTRVNTSGLMHSLHVCPCTCNVHGISTNSMAEDIFLFLMLFVIKNHQNTNNHG